MLFKEGEAGAASSFGSLTENVSTSLPLLLLVCAVKKRMVHFAAAVDLVSSLQEGRYGCPAGGKTARRRG